MRKSRKNTVFLLGRKHFSVPIILVLFRNKPNLFWIYKQFQNQSKLLIHTIEILAGIEQRN